MRSPATVSVCPSVNATVAGVPPSPGGVLIAVMSIVVDATALRLLELAPSLTTQVTSRVWLEPKLVGLAPDGEGDRDRAPAGRRASGSAPVSVSVSLAAS